MIAEIDKTMHEDHLWKHNVSKFGKRFLKELEKESNKLLSVRKADEQMMKLANIIEDELKDVYANVFKQVHDIIIQEKDNEKNKLKEVHKEVQADIPSEEQQGL